MPRRDNRLVVDCETGEERLEDLTDEELAEREVDKEEILLPSPVEELNTGIQSAETLEDIKATFAVWSERYRDLL